MPKERKFAVLFAATILAARKLIKMDADKPNMAKGYIVDKPIARRSAYPRKNWRRVVDRPFPHS